MTLHYFHPSSKPFLAFAFQKLRYQEYVERLGFEPENPYLIETDDKEEFSNYLIGINKGEVICGCRMIDVSLCEAPFAKHAAVPIERNSYEVSRYIINSDLKDCSARLVIQYELDCCICMIALAERKKMLYANMRKSLFKLKGLQSPFEWTRIGKDNKHSRKNTLFVPVTCDLSTISLPQAKFAA